MDLPIDTQEELVENYQRLLNHHYFNRKWRELQARRGEHRATMLPPPCLMLPFVSGSREAGRR